MSRSKPFDIVYYLFKPVWEMSDKYRGEKYRATSRDMGEAKQFYELNPDIFDEIPEFQERVVAYLQHRFEGWNDLKHPCWSFLRNYNSFSRKPKKVETRGGGPKLIKCGECETEHDPHVLCPKCNPEVKGTKADAIKAISELSDQWRMK